jgi:hypothetical protein
VASRCRAFILALALVSGCRKTTAPPRASLDNEARAYVRLAVALGERDHDALDFYTGPPEEVADIRRDPPKLTQIRAEASAALVRLKAVARLKGNGARQRFLSDQLRALAARADLLLGVKRTFDEEAEAFFGIRLPPADDAGPAAIRKELSILLPHAGRLVESYAAFDAKFMIPAGRLPAVMSRAIEACRQQTIAHLPLPPGEKVSVEYVYNTMERLQLLQRQLPEPDSNQHRFRPDSRSGPSTRLS